LRRPGCSVEVVEDDGPGIAADVLPRIFDMYYSSNVPASGPGIGLSIVKELTEAQGCVMSVRSEEGKGSRFSVFLPSAG
jgi:signal transduction histidine kinase